MSGISFGKKWDRPKLIQNISCTTGLLVAADVMSLRVPLYFFGQATDRVGDVFHSVARLVRHGLSDIFDQIETGSITVSDALSLVWTAILVGAGFVFLRGAWRAVGIIRPGHWLRVPRLGRRGMILAVLALGGAIAFVCQYGDLQWFAGRLVDSLWVAVKAAYANRDAFWQAALAINENKETIGQVAKGTLGAVATYVTLKFAWVAVDFALSIVRVALSIMLPVSRYGYNGYKNARRWLPHVEPDWLHCAGSLAAGSIFGLENLSLRSTPTLLWAASVPGLFFLFENEAQSASQDSAHRVSRGLVFELLCEHRNRIRAFPSKSCSAHRRRGDGRRSWGRGPSCVQLAVCSCYPFGDSQGCLFGCPNRIDHRRGARYRQNGRQCKTSQLRGHKACRCDQTEIDLCQLSAQCNWRKRGAGRKATCILRARLLRAHQLDRYDARNVNFVPVCAGSHAAFRPTARTSVSRSSMTR
jgi:hypothetical protein